MAGGARLVLVRHGRAAAGWDVDLDPGLDGVGRDQALAMADRLGPLGPLPVLTSPLRRTRETAAFLEQRWGVSATVEAAVGEIPSPTPDLAARGAWLREAMTGRWHDLDRSVLAWRDRVIATLAALGHDCVVVTHFVAINAAVGAATRDDRVVCFRPDNCSRTVLRSENGRLHVVELGADADTAVR